MVKTRLVIWDWNGTLLDDTALCYGIANEMRHSRGMPLLAGVGAYRRVFRFPIIEYYRDMGYTFETESYEALSEDFLARYASAVPGCPLQRDAEATLAAVTKLGLPQILLSATGQERLDEQIDLFGLRKYFRAVLGQPDDLAHGKAVCATDCIAACGLRPEEVVFIGDTDHDYEVSAAIGCRCLLLSSGHQAREKLEGCGVPVIDALPEALPYLS